MQGRGHLRSTAGVMAAVLGLMAAGSLQGCSRRPELAHSSGAAGAPPFQAVASLKELMESTVDPAADGLWDSVATISTAKGVDRRAPRTDEDWKAVRRHAITLIEAMNLVMMQGRHAAPPGAQAGLGELPPEQIERAVAANRPGFNLFAASVRDTALQARDAIDRKDADALFKIGGELDEKCEGCHVAFWYPNSTRPSG